MFCNQCGAQLAPGVTFCSNCGRAAVGVPAAAPAAPGAYAAAPSVGAAGRIARHRTILGVLWLIRALLFLPGGLFLVGFSSFSHWPVYGMWGGNGMPPFLAPLLGAIGSALLVMTVLAAAVGIGLLMAEGWARILAIVIGILNLISIPFGTALGIYTLWVLLPDQAAVEYAQLSQARAR